MEDITRILEDVIHGLFDVDVEVSLTIPDEKFGDFATNVAMQLSGRLSANPRDIAEKLASKLRESATFTEVSVAGPGFINLRLSPRSLINKLNAAWSDDFGSNNDGAGKVVIVEYPSPNMAKPYSVGHLRSANQGWSVKRLMETTGWKVITDNHLGDYGTPFGIWVTGFLEFSSEEKLLKDGIYELGRVYIATKKALKEEAESGGSRLSDQVQDWLVKLENGDSEAVAYSQRFKEISLGHIHDIMGRLKVSTDYELGEAFFAPLGKMAVQKLLNDGVATQNADGSVVVSLSDYNIDVPLLVQKSNGAALYATTDLATILYREDNWRPSRVIYCVGAEQQFYFTQLFAMAKKLGIKTEFIHLWFGTIDQINEEGAREKMSSRKGVVLMEELLDQAEKKAGEIVVGRDVSAEDVKKIALGAIKFSDFVADRRTNILFSWDKIFALSGFSGPYIQYAAVRANKILGDNINAGLDVSSYDYQPEKKLIMKLIEYPEIVRIAARDLEPHKVATYLYELARELNRYYEITPVTKDSVGDVEKSARMDLLGKVARVLSNGLNLLGIEIPSSM